MFSIWNVLDLSRANWCWIGMIWYLQSTASARITNFVSNRYSLNAFNRAFFVHSDFQRTWWYNEVYSSCRSPSRMLKAKATAEEAVMRESPDPIDVASSNGFSQSLPPPSFCNQRKKFLMEDKMKGTVSFFFVYKKREKNA